MRESDIRELIGKTIATVSLPHNQDEVVFETDCGHTYRMSHRQDCCESVSLYDVAGGELSDLAGQTVLDAFKTTNRDSDMGVATDFSFTWTFYTIRTNTHTLTLRWLGESNGYYSEDVDFELVS